MVRSEAIMIIYAVIAVVWIVVMIWLAWSSYQDDKRKRK